MKVNEVRVGNFVQTSNGRIWKIQSIEQIYFTVVEPNSTSTDRGTIIDFHNVHPIQLTEEWCLNFGFNYDEIGQLCFEKRLLDLVYDSHSVVFYFAELFRNPNCGHLITSTDDVHTFQNLYFALNEEEITLTNNQNK